jgi:hypothetical protein
MQFFEVSYFRPQVANLSGGVFDTAAPCSHAGGHRK